MHDAARVGILDVGGWRQPRPIADGLQQFKMSGLCVANINRGHKTISYFFNLGARPRGNHGVPMGCPRVIPLWCPRAPHGELLYAPWHNGGPCMCNDPLSPQDSSGPMDPVFPLWTHRGPCVCILHCHPHQAALRVGLTGTRVRISGSVLKSESIPQLSLESVS
jgi:hypothetical protein